MTIKNIKIGDRYNHWTVIGDSIREKKKARKWLCMCDCGTVRYVSGSHLVNGNSTNCGCIARKNTVERNRKIHRKHGGTTSDQKRLYNIYNGMHKRCELKCIREYHNYGGRGIKVCEEWSGKNGYENFRSWALDNGYNANAEKHQCTLDRIDVNGSYSPENCRWVDAKAQGNNRRDNRWITYNGETHTVSEWAEIVGIKPVTLFGRLRKGWSVEKALTQPLRVW